MSSRDESYSIEGLPENQNDQAYKQNGRDKQTIRSTSRIQLMARFCSRAANRSDVDAPSLDFFIRKSFL